MVTAEPPVPRPNTSWDRAVDVRLFPNYCVSAGRRFVVCIFGFSMRWHSARQHGMSVCVFFPTGPGGRLVEMGSLIFVVGKPVDKIGAIRFAVEVWERQSFIIVLLGRFASSSCLFFCGEGLMKGPPSWDLSMCTLLATRGRNTGMLIIIVTPNPKLVQKASAAWQSLSRDLLFIDY